MARDLGERISAAGVAVGACFILGGTAAALVLAHAPPGVREAIAAPLPVVTWQGGWGALLWSALALAIAGASVVYVYVLRALWQHEAQAAASAVAARRLLAVIVATSALAILAAAAFPVMFSSDVYAYAWYGEVALRGLNPYVHAHLAPLDALMRAAAAQWGDPPPTSVYGPAFTWLSAALVSIARPFGTVAQLDAFRLVAGAALVACVPLAYAATQGWEMRRRLVLAAGIGLNPVVVWSSAEGHNDALMLAIVLAGMILARRGRAIGGGACAIVLSALVKATGVAAAALFLVYAAARRGERAARRAALGAATGLGAVAVFSLPFAHGMASLLALHARYAPVFSPQWIAWRIVAAVLPPQAPSMAVGCTLVVLAAGALAWHGVRTARAGERSGYAVVALAAWMVLPNAYPWYALWVLPLALAAIDTRAGLTVVALTLTSAIRYVFDAAYGPDNVPYDFVAATLQYAVPLLLLIAPPVTLGAPLRSAAERK